MITKYDNNVTMHFRDSPLRHCVYRVSETLEAATNWIIKREKNRKKFAVKAKKVIIDIGYHALSIIFN